jgi:Tfp pilus assembly protein PilP
MQKLISQILTLSVLAGIATAQAKPAPKTSAPGAPASQTVKKSVPAKPTPATAKPSPMAAKPASMAKPVAKAPAKPLPVKPAAPKPKAENAAVAATTPAPKPAATSSRAKRDPFVSPVRLQGGGGPGGNPACTTGPRCLVIAQVVLKGVVKTQAGMIAMVENAAKKQYNLREKDSVQSGYVLKITTDSIVFRETVTDMLGNSNSREVVKRVTVPAV